MRRGRSMSADDYVTMRIKQLKEDREKAQDNTDKMWYSRIIQELSWVITRRENCSLKSHEVL